MMETAKVKATPYAPDVYVMALSKLADDVSAKSGTNRKSAENSAIIRPNPFQNRSKKICQG